MKEIVIALNEEIIDKLERMCEFQINKEIDVIDAIKLIYDELMY